MSDEHEITVSEMRDAIALWRRIGTALLAAPGSDVREEIRVARLRFIDDYADAIDRLFEATAESNEIVTVRKFAGHIIGHALAAGHAAFCADCVREQLEALSKEIGRAFAVSAANKRHILARHLPETVVQ